MDKIRLIDANALLEDLQEILNYEVLGNTVSDVGNGIESAMQKTMAMQTISLNTLRDAIYEDAVAHGLWEDDPSPTDCAELIRDKVYELEREAENLEMDFEWIGMKYAECEYCKWFSEELADVIIMCLSAAGKLGIDIDAAVKRKMEVNKKRPWKHRGPKQCEEEENEF